MGNREKPLSVRITELADRIVALASANEPMKVDEAVRAAHLLRNFAMFPLHEENVHKQKFDA